MTIRNIQRVTVLFLVSILTACGGVASNDLSAQSIKLAIQNEAPLSACASGGVTVNSGVDANHDLVLQNTEITGTQYICNGTNGIPGLTGFNGLAGTSGLSALVVVAGELPGINCSTGGTQVSAGFDSNQDKTLNASEVTSSNYICNGNNGNNGSSGNSGLNGTAGLNGTNGATGATGASGLAGATGATGNNGAAGATGAAGANGSAGATGATGNNGAAGSTGASGAAGSNGATGANGLKSLVTIATELPGIHCLTGGVVAKSGVDSNSNNSLDALEVTSTTYICNGETGATGAAGAAGGTGAQGATGATGATGPAGGGLSAYGYIYALIRQDVAIDAAVLFDGQSGLVNIENKAGSSDISILENGNYLVSFSVSGTQSNQFAIFVNGRVVPGSIYGSGAGTQQNNGQVIVRLEKGDTVTLVNYHSAAAVGLQSLSGGTEENVVASVTLLKLN
ncbi:collagen-like protein [Limnohabitans sp. 15K]|uniref:DUF7151 family protein n=1 Tax=Limnohabitans sp. 15K TaxID=1100706 RepID=UPI000C1F1A94|nr:collagen-like protein [Limnohabitans sp. 15K]PIT83090.1 hypothetical protein B9Z40_05315 [Limnohabitans sp. 15K]